MKKILLFIALAFLSGCKNYSIDSAESITYSRKDLVSSGKVKLEGVTTNEDGSKNVDHFQAYHTNPYFTLDVEGKNVKISKENIEAAVNK